MGQTYDVVALGELLIDFTWERSDEDGFPVMAAHPGGAPANFLCALAKYGARTGLIGKVGRDAFGDMLTAKLERSGVDTAGVQKTEEAFTTLAFVTLDEKGDRSFSFARKPGADTTLRREDVPRELIDGTKVFHFGTLSLTHEPARSATMAAVSCAREQGKLVTFDPNLRRPLWEDLAEAKKWMLWGLAQADVVKISEEEVGFLFGDLTPEEAAEKMAEEYQVKLVFLTLGEKGCYFSNRTAGGYVPALTGIRVKDTTGAGDIFGGAAVSRLLACERPVEELSQEELRQITAFACTAAGLSTTRAGGISSIPSEEEVLERMAAG